MTVNGERAELAIPNLQLDFMQTSVRLSELCQRQPSSASMRTA